MNKFTTRIINKEQVEEKTFILTLDCEPLDFQPGQFLTFILKDNQGKIKPRSYSLFSPPNATKTQLLVEFVDGGVAGEQFKAATSETEFTVMGPLGKFHFQPDHRKHVLIATNTGLAPMHSILAKHIDEYDFTLIMGAKYKKGLFLHDEFVALSSKDNFTYKPTISREEQEGIAKGYVQKLIEFDADAQYYICGSDAMVKDTREVLEKNYIPKEHIHFEVFY
jgi:NAD(P)H-flavin reductase